MDYSEFDKYVSEQSKNVKVLLVSLSIVITTVLTFFCILEKYIGVN